MKPKKKIGKSAARGQVAAPSPPLTDPVGIIVGHWSELSGIPREAMKTQLALIGHMALKKNIAGVRELEREIEVAIAAVERAKAAKAAPP